MSYDSKALIPLPMSSLCLAPFPCFVMPYKEILRFNSGLIIHHTLLPLLSRLLHIASQPDLLPSSITHLPPDVLIQDCLLGRPNSICEREDPEKGKMIITSKVIMDHTGGLATTTPGKTLNNDKWRCGWRHAFHGDQMVDVVVV